MSVRRGASHAVIVGREDSYNAGAAVPIGHQLAVAGGENLGSYQGPTIDSPELVDDLEPPQGFGDIFKSDGTFPLALDLDCSGIAFHNFMTSYTKEAVRATYTTVLAGANNDLVWTAVSYGTGGNSITVTYVDPGAPGQALSIGVVGTDITVNLATDGGSAIITTADDIKTELLGTPAAAALVTAADSGADDGSGVVTAMGVQSLAGGLGTVPWSNVWAPAVTEPSSLWMDLYDAHASTPKYDLEYGQYIQGFDFSLQKQGGLFSINTHMFGSGKHTDDGAAAQDATPTTYLTNARLQPRNAIVKIDGAHIARIREIQGSVMREMEGDGGLNNEVFHNEIIFGGYMYTISRLVATWDHASTMRALEDGAEHTLTVIVYLNGDSTRYLQIHFTGIIFPRTDKRSVPDRGPLTYVHSGLKPTGCVITLLNDTPNYDDLF